eukprot:170041_1
MAALLNTVAAGESDGFDFNQWMIHNQLVDVKELFIKHNMTSPDALNTLSDEFHQLMSDPKLLEKGHLIPTILASLKKVTKPKIVKILISEQEDEAQTKLNQYDIAISLLNNTLNELDDQLTSNIKECKLQIESLFGDIITQINSKKQAINTKLKSIEQTKRKQISENTTKINDEKKNIKQATTKVLSLQQDNTMDTVTRQQKVVSTINNILDTQLSKELININTKVSLRCQTDAVAISSVICGICDVDIEANDEKIEMTRQYEKVEMNRHFEYKPDSDNKGIIYFFGTNFGRENVYTNPANTGAVNFEGQINTSYSREHGSNEVIVTPSTHFSGSYHNVLGRKSGVQCGTTHPDPNPCFTIDFGDFEINPTAYSVRHGYHKGYCLRDWNFEGSKDGQEWTLIRKHSNDTSIQDWNEMKTFTIENKTNQYFKIFRIFKTGNCSSGTDHLMMSGFEVYGHLVLR